MNDVVKKKDCVKGIYIMRTIYSMMVVMTSSCKSDCEYWLPLFTKKWKALLAQV